MRDKQIMIDDIDVSGCKFFNDITESYYCFGIPCKDRPNCYYKQLARKMQECEQKEKELLSNEKIINKLMKEVDELKQECEELKEELNGSEKWRIKAESLNEKLDIKNTHYHKALDEIEQELKEDIYCESQECGCDDFEECLRCTKDLILDIINKAKGDNR